VAQIRERYMMMMMMMVMLFDITACKTVIFLAIFNRESYPDVTCREILFFSFIPNEVNLAQVCYLFYWQTDKDNACFMCC
jgi:hypothetical protein